MSICCVFIVLDSDVEFRAELGIQDAGMKRAVKFITTSEQLCWFQAPNAFGFFQAPFQLVWLGYSLPTLLAGIVALGPFDRRPLL